MKETQLTIWQPIQLPALLEAGKEPRDLQEIERAYPALVSFVEERLWTSGQDGRFALALVNRVPSILTLGPAWRGQLVSLLQDLRLALDHDRATAARADAAAVGFRPKIFALIEPGQTEVASARRGRWRLLPLESERGLLPLDVIDRCAALQGELRSRGDEADSWATARELPASGSRADTALVTVFGRWLLELTRWRER